MKTFATALALAAFAFATTACDQALLAQAQGAAQNTHYVQPQDEDHKCPVYSKADEEKPASPSCPSYPWYKTM